MNHRGADAPPGRKALRRSARRIGEAIAPGATITGLCARREMPSLDTFYVWVRRHPAFAKEVETARDFRDWLAADRAVALAEAGRIIG